MTSNPAPGQYEEPGTERFALFDLPAVVTMGVSGAGKTVIGGMLADTLGGTFVDGDDLHPEVNREKMRQGIALEDSDRFIWLEDVASETLALLELGQLPVVACSALKKSYRDLLLNKVPSLFFLYLAGDKALVQERIEKRKHSFMPVELLSSQYQTLEAPEAGEPHLTVDLRLSPQDIVALAAEEIRQLGRLHSST